MADQSDIRKALADLITAALLPTGGIVATSGQGVTIGEGWPTPDALGNLSAPGAAITAMVTVYPDQAMSRNTTRYNDAGQTLTWSTPASTMGVTVADPLVTFTGTPAAGQAVGIAIGRPEVAYTYRVLPTDTLATVATAIAALIPSALVPQHNPTAVHMPNKLPISANVLMDGQVVSMPRRQEDMFHVTIWTATPQDRDTLGTAVDQALAGLTFIALPDGTEGHITYHRTSSTDKSERSLTYWRDLLYAVEYPTAIFQTLPRALFIDTSLNSGAAIVQGAPAT